MELLTYKDSLRQYTYYINEHGDYMWHGEAIHYDINTGKVLERNLFYHDQLHGESIQFYARVNGIGIRSRCFFIDGKHHPYVEMNEQEKLLFQIQHPGFRFIDG